jgi:hypothetical protein
MTNDSQKLTDSEKHAFLFGYLRGHMKGIQGIFEKTHTKNQSEKKWKTMVTLTSDLHSVLCRELDIEEGITEEFSKFMTEMEDEIEELTEVKERKDE